MRPTTKRKVKKWLLYGFIFSVCFFIILISGAIPELNSIGAKIFHTDNSANSVLYAGETAKIDGLSIIVKDVQMSNNNGKYEIAPEGGKFLFIKIEVTNIGKVKTHRDTLPAYRHTIFDNKERINLYYDGTAMPGLIYVFEYSPDWSGYGAQYPGITKDGWIGFEVPAGIDLKKTTLNIHGIKWILSK